MNKIIIPLIILFLLFGTGCISNVSPIDSNLAIDTITTFSAESDTYSTDIFVDGIFKQTVNTRKVSYIINPQDYISGTHTLTFRDLDDSYTWNIDIINNNTQINTINNIWNVSYEEQVRIAQEKNKNKLNNI